MFDLFLAALSLAPLGLFLLFWRVFPRDTAVHPIYRESEIVTTDKRTGVQDLTPSEAAFENGSTQEQSSLSTDRLSGVEVQEQIKE
jgi:hypothetical protein